MLTKHRVLYQKRDNKLHNSETKNRTINSTFATIILFGFCSQSSILNAHPPDGVTEIPIQLPDEVSGVAATSSSYLVVGDGEPRYIFDVKKQKQIQVTFGNEKGNICDPEAIDVGIKPDGTEKIFILGEDAGKVFVEGGAPIVLPSGFHEQCNRGAEGLSVKWSQGGWDLVVLSEGGIPNKKHVPNSEKSPNCKRVKQVTCPVKNAVYNPILARYRVSENGDTSELKYQQTLQTSHLLENINEGQGFRATDLTWLGDRLLVLLGSAPRTRDKKSGYLHTWIVGFNPDGTSIPEWTIKLEDKWGSYRSGKNWEGLDTSLDGSELLLAYDSRTVPSELVRFKHQLKRD